MGKKQKGALGITTSISYILDRGGMEREKEKGGKDKPLE